MTAENNHEYPSGLDIEHADLPDLDVGSTITVECEMCGCEAESLPAIAPTPGTLLWNAPADWGSLLRPDQTVNGITPTDLICPRCARKVADAALGLDGVAAGSARVELKTWDPAKDTGALPPIDSPAAGAALGLQNQDARVGTEPGCK